MVARPTTPFRSANAGEFSQDAAGRVDIKQYYSAGLAFKNIEPVPQGGFRQMGGSWRVGKWRRPLVSRAITSPSLDAGPHTGTQTVWTGTVAGTVAAVLISGITWSAGNVTFIVEAFVSGEWVQVGGNLSVDGSAATRLAAFAPGGQQTATSLRIRATFSTSSTIGIASVAAYYEDGTPLAPRAVALASDDGTEYRCFITEGVADFFNDGGHCGAAWLPDVTEAMLPDLDFYAEARTIGVFHGSLETIRLFLPTVGLHANWRVDLWPYAALPLADLGGSYSKTNDVWEIFVRWTGTPQVFLALTVNGETTPAIPVQSGGSPADISTTSSGDRNAWAAALEDALEDLPSLGAGVTVGYVDVGSSASFKLVVTFGGALSGVEYQFSATVTNTSDASALPYHTAIGETDFEPVWSSSRGWPGFAELAQDRMLHVRNPAVPGAIGFSESGEYFTFNLQAQGDNAARFDKLRSQTAETVLAVKESTYLLAFSNKAAYFNSNRTISRNSPPNFVKASEIGIQPNCRPFDLEGVDYFIAINPNGLADYSEGGKQLLEIVPDNLSADTRYVANPVSLLSTHLVDKVIRASRQRPETDLDAAKGWLMRSDGRLVAGQFIKSQEILGFCEWIAASGGQVREILVDNKNSLWLAIERSGAYSIERYDTAQWLQDAVEATPDLAGAVTGLPYEDDAEVWAIADGFVVGPFTVSAGALNLGDSFSEATIGRWRAPLFQSMPMVFVNSNDEVVWRPGRIHTVHANLIGTSSIAIGANGESPLEVDLTRFGDADDAPPPARTELLTVTGIAGATEGTTAVITQLRPGALRIRDISLGAKL
ncbi:hypothetical protein [Mesorhizobium sp. Z1-4]|uniref:hypothetical protein n=1 Tax=Mesorhizobium sp. Z1-4 TaxID=2448478 RepID=UPI000FD6EBF0|nr:hypothetical protein [Mesorhizobium sp. Z1-4]